MQYQVGIKVRYIQTIGVDADHPDDLIDEIEDVLRQNRYKGYDDIMEYDGADEDWKIQISCNKGHSLADEISIEEVGDFLSCPICEQDNMTPIDRWLARMKEQKVV